MLHKDPHTRTKARSWRLAKLQPTLVSHLSLSVCVCVCVCVRVLVCLLRWGWVARMLPHSVLVAAVIMCGSLYTDEVPDQHT